MRAIVQCLGALWRGRNARRGVAAIEFAMLAPLLVIMAVALTDYGLGVYYKMEVQNAAQAGVQYAVLHGFNATNISTAVTSASTLTGISANPAPAQSCGCASGTTISSASCGSTCPSGLLAGGYVTVSAQATYSTILPYPGLDQSFTFTSQALVRVN